MSSPTQSVTELRLFNGDLDEAKSLDTASDDLWKQIPSLPNVMECFESVTGWELAFKEKRSNIVRRQSQGSAGVVRGKLEIIDMSDRIELGQVAGNRQRCNQLADAISELISMLQENRESLQAVNQQVTKVVDPPFEWWGIAGQTGFCDGNIANWSISPDEQVRLFVAQLEGMNSTDLAIGCSAMLAAFESSTQIGITLDQVAMLLPRILRGSCQQGQRIENFATVELDPITGEFRIDGYQAAACVSLLDLSAGAFVDVEAENLEGILYSGQVLIVGMGASQRKELQEIVSQTEMTTQEFRRIFERKFGDSAALMMYRK